MSRPKGSKNALAADLVEQELMGNTGTVEKSENTPEVVVQDIPGAVVEKPVDPEYKIEVIKDYYGNMDPFYLPNKDPRYEYSFARADDKNLSIKTGNMLFQGGGWQLCGREHLKRIGIEDRYIGPDGLHRRGDLVLAFIPKHLYAEKLANKKQRADSMMEAVNKMINEGSEEGSGIHESMKGIQTQEQLGLK